MHTTPKHVFLPIIDYFSSYATMLPELHTFKELFYAKSVGVVTFGHMTKDGGHRPTARASGVWQCI